MIRVLIVDDSALIRSLLKEMLSKQSDIEVVGAAPDAYIARDMVNKHSPDVITLDIEMPKMDGITFLSKLMKARPTPVIMISTLTEQGADATLKCLELGAVDFVAKPKVGVADGMVEYQQLILDKVRAASKAKIRKYKPPTVHRQEELYVGTEKVIAVGASTGGTETIKAFLQSLPANSPAVVITLHMPPGFTRSYAARLNESCHVSVSEATAGQRVLPGHAYLAPGDRHMVVRKSGADYKLALLDSERVSGHKPSVDVMFDSVASEIGPNAVALIMTGMGRDGAKGLLEIRRRGGYTIAQSEETCVVFGMPGEAIKLGGVDIVVSIDEMANETLAYLKRSNAGSRL